MKINSSFIEMGLHKGELNKAQLEILGHSSPPLEGWETLVEGRELSTKDTNLFLLLRGKLAIKAQEQIIKNYQLVAEFHKQKNIKKEKPKEVFSDKIEIYCDGACKGNPGKAGSGLAIYGGGTKPRLLYGAYEANGTNNTAELNALYKALLIASKTPTATIYSDSKYSIDCVTKWAYGWKSKGWTKKGGEIKNLEIIKLSHELYERIKERVSIHHVKGHAGVEGNELADRMAVYAIVSCGEGYADYDYEDVRDVLEMTQG
jgi:ribonuclease HI